MDSHMNQAKEPNPAEETVAFMTRLEVEAMLPEEKEKASSSVIRIYLKPPYPAKLEESLI